MGVVEQLLAGHHSEKLAQFIARRAVVAEITVTGARHEDVRVLDLEASIVGVLFSIGIRKANHKSMRLAMTVGYRVVICDNMAVVGDFMPVLHKHSKNLDLIELVSIGVDKIQRNFEPLRRKPQIIPTCACSGGAALKTDFPFGLERPY